jgi:outer membrane protein assembly factor BamB
MIGPNIMTAPAVMGNRVYVVGMRNDGKYALVVLELADGKQVCDVPLPCDIVGSPVCGFRSVYLTLTSGRVVCLDEAGKLRWEREFEAASAPWVDEGGVLVALRSADDPRVLCADPLDGRVLWRTTAAEADENDEDGRADPRASVANPRAPAARAGPMIPVGWAADPPRPAATEDLVVLAAGRDLVAFDRETGARRQHLRLPAGRSFSAPPAVLGNRLLYATMDGLLVEISPKLSEFFRALDTGLTVTAQPVVADGMAFVAGNGVLLAVPWGERGEPEWPQWGGTAARTGR